MASKITDILNKKWFSILIVIFATIILFAQADRRFGYTSEKEKENNCIVSDGNGYYVYLPQYIVYPDSNHFSFIDGISKKYPNSKFFEMVERNEATEKFHSKFYTGTAVLQAPFYLVAHLVHTWNSWNSDGYSLGYRFSIQLAALFYWLIGVLALFKLFTRLAFKRFHILLAIIIVTFGTNLNYYTSYYVSMSHVYSFAMVACFLNVAQLWASKRINAQLLWMLFLIGIIAIIRPVNILVVLIVPFFFASLQIFWMEIIEVFKSKKRILFFGILLLCIPISIQLMIQYDQTGSISINTYSNEGFSNALTPQFWNVLFSYHKGFFVYAPVMFLLFIGLYFFIRNSERYFLIGWWLCAAIWLYAICSWWCWDYGGGLGMRALIELLPLFIFPLLYLFKFAHRILLGISWLIIVAGIAVYQMFQVQFNSEIIHCCAMEKESFWGVFMKTDLRFRWKADFDSQREYLTKVKLKTEYHVKYESENWKIPQGFSKITAFKNSYDDNATLTISTDTYQQRFYAKIKGEILLNDPKCNPFFTVKYLNDSLVIDESFFTIGSGVNDAFSSELFEIEVNHAIPNGCVKVEVTFHNGGCKPMIKQVVFTKFIADKSGENYEKFGKI